jgi:hypothetical protein
MSALPLLEEHAPESDAIAVVDTPSVPALVAQAPASATQVFSVKSELSFCIPTSLAFFKDLTWEQTPWTHRYIASRAVASPITPTDADKIYSFSANHDISQEAIENSLFFGTSSAGIDLFVVFPHVDYHTNPATDARFLNIWHDQIVKPAFDHAWKDSGLTTIHGADVNAISRIMPPAGTHTDMEALPAEGFIKRLKNGSPGSISANWPKHNPEVLHEAWRDIAGMLKDHPDLQEFQNPILLAVYRAEIHMGGHLNPTEQYQGVYKGWELLATTDYIEPGSFGVVLETIVGRRKVEEAIEEPFALEGDAQPKRKAREGFGLDYEDEDEDAHRNKRRK